MLVTGWKGSPGLWCRNGRTEPFPNVPSSSITKPGEILYATDFREPSRRALLYVKKLALQCGAAVRSIHVIDVTDPTGAGDRSFSAARHSAERMLREVRRELRLAGLQETAMLVTAGRPAEAIRETIAQEKPRIVALGLNVARSDPASCMGSTAGALLQTAPCAVLTVGTACPEHPGPGTLEHTLLITDGTAGSMRAARTAWPPLRSDKAAEVYAVTPPGGMVSAREFLNDSKPVHVIAEPTAAETILDYARECGTDLIVVSRKPGSSLDSFAQGGLACTLASAAPCPVLWVRA